MSIALNTITEQKRYIMRLISYHNLSAQTAATGFSIVEGWCYPYEHSGVVERDGGISDEYIGLNIKYSDSKTILMDMGV